MSKLTHCIPLWLFLLIALIAQHQSAVASDGIQFESGILSMEGVRGHRNETFDGSVFKAGKASLAKKTNSITVEFGVAFGAIVYNPSKAEIDAKWIYPRVDSKSGKRADAEYAYDTSNNPRKNYYWLFEDGDETDPNVVGNYTLQLTSQNKTQLFQFTVSLPAAISPQHETLKQREDVVVEFKNRNINVSSFLNAFPYDQWRWEGSLKHDVLYFLKKDANKSSIYRSTLGNGDSPAILENAIPASLADFSSSLTFAWKVNAHDGSLFFKKDENNDEHFNLHRLQTDGKLTKLSSVNYVAGMGLSPDGKKVAYSERTGPEGARFKIHVLDLESLDDKVVASDSEEQQFTWYDISWQPNGQGLAMTTLTDGDRTRGNISLISTSGSESQRPKVITDPAIGRSFPQVTKHWLSSGELLILSNEKGAKNLYALNVETKEQRQISNFGSDVVDVEMAKGSSSVVVTVKNPLATKLYRLDASKHLPDPILLLEKQTDCDLLDMNDEGEVLLHRKSATLPFIVESGLVADDRVNDLKSRVTMAPELIQSVVHSTAEPVLYDTFDDVAMTLGDDTHRGKIHGILYSPLKPLPTTEGLAVVEAFYGGANTFDVHTQILCAAGIHVFSPAPRGVGNVSEEFEKLNDGDLGGYEVIDVMYGGKFLSRKLNLTPSQIGVFGHSHGGYETMRQMTFPGEVGDVKFAFPWGFGIAESGFASIKGQYDASNIKNWIAKEAGKPELPGSLDQWEDRSPINHAKRLTGNLLLIHGTNDQRVPYIETKSLYDKLIDLGKEKQVRLVPLEGVGHVAVAEKDVVTRYKAWFEFLAEQK